MCGIVGIVSSHPVNQQVYDALLLLQHRGQDSTGIATAEADRSNDLSTVGLQHNPTTAEHYFCLLDRKNGVPTPFASRSGTCGGRD